MEKENNPELRMENQQQLTDRAQMIEEAKRIAEAISHNPEETKRNKLKTFYPELSAQEIEDLIQ